MNKAPTKSIVFKVSTCIILLAAVISYALQIFTGNNMDGVAIVAITFFMSTVSALSYCIYGTTKENQSFFRWCFILYSLYNFANILYYDNGSFHTAVGVSAISLGISTVFSVADNLGEKKSVLLVLVNFLLNIFSFYTVQTTGFSMAGPLATLLLSIALLLMVYAKYDDKAERGSK